MPSRSWPSYRTFALAPRVRLAPRNRDDILTASTAPEAQIARITPYWNRAA